MEYHKGYLPEDAACTLRFSRRKEPPSFTTELNTLFCTGIVPTDRRRGIVSPIGKRKDDTQNCNNYKGGYHPLCVRRVPGTNFSRQGPSKVINSPVTGVVWFYTQEVKSTVGHILALRVLNGRLCNFRTGLSAAFVDLRKAFDSLKRHVL